MIEDHSSMKGLDAGDDNLDRVLDFYYKKRRSLSIMIYAFF